MDQVQGPGPGLDGEQVGGGGAQEAATLKFAFSK
jgi:hypothetical protein